MKRRRKPAKMITMLQLGIAGVLLICLGLLMVWYTEGLSSFKPGKPTFQYVTGMKIAYNENAVYRITDDVVSVSDRVTSGDTFGIPILYEDEAKLTLSENMLLMVPRQGSGLRRVNCFTHITEQSGLVTFKKDAKTAEVYGGFLYDGEDTYVFLEETTLTIGTKEVVLAPLSYAIVNYQQNAEYYNSGDGSYELISLFNTDVLATVDDDYVIDLGKDSIEMGQGESLLYSAVDTVANIDMEK